MTTDSTTTDTTPRPGGEITPSRMLMSLTGFDELAIAAHFGAKMTAMRQEDAVTAGRALAFVHMRRSPEHTNDKDAYTAAMMLPMGEVTTYFAPEPKDDDEAEGVDPAAAAEALGEDMAAWCVGTGFAPSEWKALTQGERNAIARAHNDAVAAAR